MIALDVMGGDAAPEAILTGASAALEQFQELRLLLIGPAEVWKYELATVLLRHPRVTYQTSATVIDMADSPVRAVRQKPDSSLVMGVRCLAEAQVNAFVTAGNSGATVVAALKYLDLLPGIERPALAVLFPGQAGETLVLDVGAQVSCRPEHLLQFARLGSAFAKAALQLDSPRVGLLNIGEEATKGNALARQTHALLAASDLNFIGNIEGWDLPTQRADVAVCDGFVGNLLLKLTEGLSEYFMRVCPPLSQWPGSERFHYVEQGGSLLLGLNQQVVLTHGRANATAVINSIGLALRSVAGEALAQIKQELKCEESS